MCEEVKFMYVSPLYNLIQAIEYGTKLRIGIVFLKNYGNELCKLPQGREFHYSPVCNKFKKESRKSYFKCFHCSNYVIKKVIKSKKTVQGICINGIYEYTHPVIINDDVACIIFIGNILNTAEQSEKTKKLMNTEDMPLSTLQTDFSPQQCKNTCLLIEDYILHLLEKAPANTHSENLLIENIQNYISANLGFDISIKDIAEIFHYNPNYLGRLFKKETGLSFNQYITLCRINKAKELLINTKQSCIEISNKIGFNNVTYFNSIFKKHTGMTPKEYKKEKIDKTIHKP